MRIRGLCAICVVGLALGGCASALGDLTAPPPVRPTETIRAPSFPAVGVTPAAPAPELSSTERARLRARLEAERAGNSQLAATPATSALPRLVTPP
jgi:hypothetical protein